MSETGASKRPRKVVNYAAMDSLDISDDDEFSGFSSPVSKPPHHKPHKDFSKNEKSKLQKKRKLTKQRHIADSEVPLTSEADDSDSASAPSAPRPRPALHEKLFQRDLEAALELSRQCAELAAPEENEENLPGSSFSPPRPLQSPSAVGITPVTVPVEVHRPKTSPAHPSLVCRKGNTDVRILPEAAPKEGDAIDQIVLEYSHPGSDSTEAEGDCLNRSAEHNEANSALLVNGFKKFVKKKAFVIESDDDDFNTATHHNGVTSTLVGETRIIIRNKPEKVSPLLQSKPNASEDEDAATSSKVRKVSKGVDESSANNVMKGKPLATPRPEADLPTSGRGKRARRAVSFLPEPDSESEDEWAEPDELDEDDLSQSEGSDFEPSPKKDKKKKAPPNKKGTSTKTLKKHKSGQDTLKQSTGTLTNSSPSSVSSAADTPRAVGKSLLNLTPSSATHISNSKAVKPFSLSKHSTTPCTTSIESQFVSESLVSHGGRATSSSPVTAPVLSKNNFTSAPPLAGLARAAFKCPVINGATNGGSPAAKEQATSLPTGTLRLGLSRRASLKPLHPNATVK